MHKRWCILMILGIILLDVITKIWVSRMFYLGEVLTIIPGFALTLAHNTGAAFRFLADEGGWQRIFLSGVALFVTMGFSVWLWRTPSSNRLTCLGLPLIIAGALGNLWDRVAYGYVIDFIDFYIGSWHWPAFNIADSAICIGTALLIWGMVRGEK